MWLGVITPEEDVDPPLVFDAYLDAYDEFEAAPFIVAHGWYRQATSTTAGDLARLPGLSRFVGMPGGDRRAV
jgi:hypothetical protein